MSDYISRVKAVNLPEGEFFVCGSAIMDVLGIRKAADMDILVSPRLYEKLEKEDGWKKHPKYNILQDKDKICGAKTTLDFMKENYSLEEVLPLATYIEGVPFMSLEMLINAKEQMGREKDFADIKLIKEYQYFNSIKGKILDSKGYRERLKGISNDDLYCYELHNDERALYYFGVRHSSDVDNPMFLNLKQTFMDFKPDMVLVEGNPRINDDSESYREELRAMSEDEAKTRGESRYTLKLSSDNNIDAYSPDPDVPEVIEYLVDLGYTQKDICYFYLYSELHRYARGLRDDSFISSDFEEYITPQIEELALYKGWTTETLNELVHECVSNITSENMDYCIDQLSPIPEEGETYTVINEISQQSSYFRDLYIVKKIIKYGLQYKRLFIVFGSGHAIKEETALRSFFELLN
jgi:hypothetical protein